LGEDPSVDERVMTLKLNTIQKTTRKGRVRAPIKRMATPH
jgi:hypothetical protein